MVASTVRSGAATRNGTSASRIAAAFGQRSVGVAFERALDDVLEARRDAGADVAEARCATVVRRATAVPISVSAPNGALPVSIS